VDDDSLVNQGRVVPLPLQVATLGMEDGVSRIDDVVD